MIRHLRKNYAKFVFRAWRYRLRAERPEIRFLLNQLQLGHTAIDIGAHKGAYTYWMSQRVGSSGQVIAFEPQPELNQTISKLMVWTEISDPLWLVFLTKEALGEGEYPGSLNIASRLVDDKANDSI